jgi:hypothetical protein
MMAFCLLTVTQFVSAQHSYVNIACTKVGAIRSINVEGTFI